MNTFSLFTNESKGKVCTLVSLPKNGAKLKTGLFQSSLNCSKQGKVSVNVKETKQNEEISSKTRW